MVHHPVFKLLSQCLILPSALLGSALAPVALASSGVAIEYNYGQCATDLLAVGLSAESAAAACAQALYPEEVSGCVLGVTTITDLTAEAALSACSRDRRPLEVATCVAHIQEMLPVDNAAPVLENCHHSILPVRYADCVVDIALATALATTESMALCIAAGDRPVEVAPSFIPVR